MKMIPVDGEEIAITIDERAQMEALIGSDKLMQIGVTGGKILVFSEESPIMRDDEPFYPPRNNRASKLRGRRVSGTAIIGSLNEMDFDKYEGVETMVCRRCRETVAHSDDTSLCDTCFAEKKRGAGVLQMAVAVFAAGWVLGGLRVGIPAGAAAVAPAATAPVAVVAPAAASPVAVVAPAAASPTVAAPVATSPVVAPVAPAAPVTPVAAPVAAVAPAVIVPVAVVRRSAPPRPRVSATPSGSTKPSGSTGEMMSSLPAPPSDAPQTVLLGH